MVTGGPASAPQAPRLLCVPGHVLFPLCSSGLPSPLSWAFEPAAPSAERSVPSFLSLPPLLPPLPVQMSPINRPSPPTECEGTLPSRHSVCPCTGRLPTCLLVY